MSEDSKPQKDDGAPDQDLVEDPPAETDPLTELQQQIGELKERMIRSQAEFDNVRKRLRREADEAGTRAIARFCRPILDQVDNLNRALEAANPDAFAEFAQGVAMIKDGLLQSLAAQGIEPVPAEGVFDPAVHEVLAEMPNADVPKGSIIAVHRAGYRLGDQLVRSAQVVVAKPA